MTEEWTLAARIIYEDALREADARFQAERDRRYQEVAVEREKALAISEQVQAYKDEKANELRSQIERERGSYVTRLELVAAVEKIEVTLKTLTESRSESAGARRSSVDSRTLLLAGLPTIVAIAAVLVAFFHK